MTKIIHIQDYLDAGDTLDLAKNMLQESQDDMALENQQLLAEVMALEANLESQSYLSVSLKSQLKELQVENDILLDALEANEEHGLPVMLNQVVSPAPQAPSAAHSHYWEQEYSLLKDKIRHMEQLLVDKDKALQQASGQNQQLLNELLAKS